MAAIVIVNVYAVTYQTVDFGVFVIPSVVIFSVWVGLGLGQSIGVATALMRRSQQSWRFGPLIEKLGTLRVSVALSVLAIGLVPGTSLALNYGSQNLRGDDSALQYAKARLDALPEGAVVVSDSEADVFSLWYLEHVVEPERDVATIALPLLQFDWYWDDLRRMYPVQVPSTRPEDVRHALALLVAHNNQGPGVFFTFRNAFVAQNFVLTQVGPLFRATIKQ